MFGKLQEKIAKKLCPEVFNDIHYYKERSRKWELEFYTLENEIESYRKINTGLKKIIDLEKHDLCKLAFDKDQNPLVLAISNYKTSYKGDEVIIIRVLCPTSYSGHELHVNATVHYKDSKLIIEDIQGGYNKGYGTAAMQEIISIAKRKSLKKIVGQLCNEDLKEPEHRNRLVHFYEKFGFSVTITQENNILEGKIISQIANHLEPNYPN